MSDSPNQTDPEQEPEDSHPLRRIGGERFESLLDQHMREAERAGHFRNLPGSGKPLKLDNDQHVPEEVRLGFRMLKGAGFAPPWIELQQSIRHEQAQLDAWVERVNQRWPQAGPQEREQLRADHEQKIRDLNRMITNYNLTAPPVAGQMPLLQLWRERQKLNGAG